MYPPLFVQKELPRMSIDAFWPLFPKSIDEKVWQKKKGLLVVKKTGVSELISAAEKAFGALKPAY